MNIQLNGEAKDTDAKNLAELLAQSGFENAAVATAVNGEFVPAAARAACSLKNGDQIEILAPMQGG